MHRITPTYFYFTLLYLLLSLGATPILPARGDDDVVHVSIDVHSAGVRPPRSSQVDLPGARNLAVDECEPRVFIRGGSLLCRERSRDVRVLRHGVELAILEAHTQQREQEAKKLTYKQHVLKQEMK